MSKLPRAKRNAKLRRMLERKNFHETLAVGIVELRLAGASEQVVEKFTRRVWRDRVMLLTELRRHLSYIHDGRYMFGVPEGWRSV